LTLIRSWPWDRNTLKELAASLPKNTQTKALSRAIQSAPLDQLATDRVETSVPKVFTHQLERLPVTNQARSGRCWLFAGLNVLRPALIKKLKLSNFEFSYNYLYFYDKLEKSKIQVNIFKNKYDKYRGLLIAAGIMLLLEILLRLTILRSKP